MIATRWILPALAAVVLLAPTTGAGAFGRKGKADARVKQLTETLRTEADEAKRLAAIGELRDADPRAQGEVIPALVAALQRDPVPQVRAAAAEAIGLFKTVFPTAGEALETVADADPSTAVREAARQALWEYHLAGYRSLGGEVFPGSTPEPPLARPESPRPAGLAVAPVVPAAPAKPAPAVATPLPAAIVIPLAAARPSPVPATGLGRFHGPGRVVSRVAFRPRPEPPAPESDPPGTLRVILTSAPPLELHASAEPPLAQAADQAVATPPAESSSAYAAAPVPNPAPIPVPLPPLIPPPGTPLPEWLIGLPDITSPPELSPRVPASSAAK